MTKRALLMAMAIVIFGHGCAEAHRTEVMTVLANGNCQTNVTGVQLIDYEALAALRGTRLIGMTQAPDGEAAPVHLIAIMPGEYPTPGYSLALDETTLVPADPLILQLEVTKPPSDAILAQVVAHPCLVVGIDDQSVKRVRVIDAEAQVIGEVDLSKPQ